MTTIGHYKIVGCCIDAGFLCHQKMRFIAFCKSNADGYEPHRYHCRTCRKSWDVDHPATTGPAQTVCSDCYGDKITITKLRLWFDRALAEIVELIDGEGADTARLDRLEALPGIAITYRPEDVAMTLSLRSEIDSFLARLDEGK